MVSNEKIKYYALDPAGQAEWEQLSEDYKKPYRVMVEMLRIQAKRRERAMSEERPKYCANTNPNPPPSGPPPVSQVRPHTTETEQLCKALALVRAECEAWRKACDEYTGDIRVVFGQAGHIAAIVETRGATDKANALEAP